MEDTKEAKPRGFAAMTPERRREIAAKGGRTAQARGTAHRFTPEEAREAGRKAHSGGRAHRFTPEEAREAGRKGGRSPRRPKAAPGAGVG